MSDVDERRSTLRGLEGEHADPPAVRAAEPAVYTGEESETILAIMNGVTRRGPWEPAGQSHVVAFWGGVKLDFREAALFEGTTQIEIFALMGGVEIIVPADVNVRSNGLGIAGAFSHVAHAAREADAPTLEIRGLAIMGGVEVKIA